MADPKEKMPRTASSQAMQSLFSAYDEDAKSDSDSAGEEEEVKKETTAPATEATEATRQSSKDSAHGEFSGSEDEVDKIKMSPIHVPVVQAAPAVDSPLRVEVAKPVVRSAMPKLVSYEGGMDMNDDTDNEDDAMDIDSDVGDEEIRNKPIVDYDQTFNADLSIVASPAKDQSREPVLTLASGEEVRLPPEPTGKCSKSVQAKIARYHDKMVYQHADLSSAIERRKDFRNPSIYEKLIHFIDIDEKGTNYPPELYDPSIWGPDSFYDNLAKVQKEEMDKREKEKKEKTKVEFVTATKKVDQSALDKHLKNPRHKRTLNSRRSKWDAQPPGGAPAKAVISGPSVASNPTIASITSAPSGTKSTVISASGTLKKAK